uniref:Uncharacterized protein n=1 Tax=Steinernema glaseri TaxID=37863 RepID=A0A1I7YTB5_9BILA
MGTCPFRSLNEVENTSDNEDDNDPQQQLLANEPVEREEDQLAKVQLNWKENFLVCIGLADPKKLKAKKLLEEDVEGSGESSQRQQEEHEMFAYDDRSSATEGTVGSDDLDDERTPMMDQSASVLNSWRTAEDRSFITRSSFEDEEERKPSAANNWLLAPHAARRAISMQERHRITPIRTQEHAQSIALLRGDQSFDQDVARRSNMNLLQSSDEERRDATRPPTEENSFRDPTPTNYGIGDDPRFEYANPYSSYAAAMVSPFIADDRTFTTPEPSTPQAPRSPVRPPKFRISSSPPRRRISHAQSGGETPGTGTDSDTSANRQFLLRVTQPPTPKEKTKKAGHQQTTV